MVSSFIPARITNSLQNPLIIKMYFIVTFYLISLCALLAWGNPANNYEISIYFSTPWVFWIFIFSIMIVSLGIFIFFLYHNKSSQNIYLHLCLLAIYLSYILVNALFIIRGYYAWNMMGDGSSHLGWTRDLMFDGHIPNNYHMFYPALHIFLAGLVDITSLNLITLHKIVPVLFGILFVFFMFVFARSIFPKGHGVSLLVALLSCCFILPCTLLAPNMNSNLIFPFMLMVYVMALKSSSRQYVVLLSILIPSVAIFHPITAIIFGLIVFSVFLYGLIVRRYKKNSYFEPLLKNHVNEFAILLLCVWYFFWFLQFWYFGETIRSMYDSVIMGVGIKYSVMGQAIENASMVGNNPIIEIIKRYGQQMLVITLSFVGVTYLFCYDRLSKNYRTLRVFTFPFLVLIAFMIAMVGAMGFTMATRYLSYIMIIGILFCAYLTIGLLIRTTEKRNFHSVIVIIIVVGTICAVMTLGFFTVYPSPYNDKASYHTTKMSVSCMEWFFEHRDIEIPLIGISIAPGRYADLLLSPDDRKEQKLPYYMTVLKKDGTVDDRRPPVHFGYKISSSLGDFYNHETDLITNRQDIEYYRTTRPELGALYWQTEDFLRLANDQKVSLVYCNSEYTMWKIKP